MHSLARPLQAHTWLDMAHLMGEWWVTQTRVRALWEVPLRAPYMTAKGSRHAFGMAKARVRSVPTGVCMSTLLRTGAALDMLHFDERVVARSSLLFSRARRCRMLWALS